MKIVLFFLSVFLWNLGFSQKSEVDTTQIVVPNRVNDPKNYDKPYVILISSDGFRYDYIEKFGAKHLEKLGQENVWAKDGIYPAYPSITFPNHYSIITGMYPAHNGIVDNVFYDDQRKEMYKIGSKTVVDGSWYGGLPFWGLAESQGLLSASLFWVGSESDAAGIRPTYYYPYHEKFSDYDKVKIIKNWLTLPEEKRPHFITLYFPEVDHFGHVYGPDSVENKAAVHYVDNAVQLLVDALSPLNLPINFIFISDHGMLEVKEENYIPMPEIDKDKFVVVNSNTFARITAKDKNDILSLYEGLKGEKSDDYKVYLQDKFPKKYHLGKKDDKFQRVGDIILLPKNRKLLVSPERKPTIGKHGYDPRQVPEMKSVFMAWGPEFKKEKSIRPFENVNVYPMMAEILGLKIPHAIDGKAKVLKKILKKD